MIEYSFRELESFVAVAEELSFTRAAARLRLAQPPLSRHIKILEDRLGLRLFDRTNRTVALTSAGRTFYEEVREPLLKLQRASSAAQRTATGAILRLEIGFVSSLLDPELADVFRRFRQAFPDVQLTLHDLVPSEQLKTIAQGHIDGGFIGLAPTQRMPGLNFVTWKKEALLLFVPNDHPCAKQRSILLKRVSRDPFIAISADAAPAFASKVQLLCREGGFRPSIVQEATRAQAVVAMVAAGSGVAVLPASVRYLNSRAVTAITLRDKGSVVPYVVAHRAGPVTAALKRFLGILTGEYSEPHRI